MFHNLFPPSKKEIDWWLVEYHSSSDIQIKSWTINFKKQLEHFWDDSIDPLNLTLLQPRTSIMTGIISEGVKIFHLVTPTTHPSNKNYTKYLQCVK